ncbi:MAG TPA: molybdenum cofactor biosynthesis protein MoaE [Acidimicrobiales bacterium]|nr:molybdenum cofactor biosynthesis protein MoaE [Acidimicrobiales bacterium]
MTAATVDTWLGLWRDALPVAAVSEWAVRPDCGAVVVFTGTVRNHAEGRSGVSALDYEAYEEQVEPRLAAVASEARTRWPGVGRLALLHRTGHLGVGEPAVVVAVSAAHRGEAFDAARFCIDTVKDSVPIWKKETWDRGQAWVDPRAHAPAAP